MIRKLAARCLAATLVGTIVLAGCGLKGALALPEKSERVIIRGPGGEPVTGSAPATEGSGAAPATASGAAAPPAPPLDERLPPPPLPGGNPGASHGG